MKVILSCSLGLLLSWALSAATDPTRPELKTATNTAALAAAEAQAKASDKFKLKLIKNDQGQRMALINGKALKQGDTLEGYQVLTITDQEVILQQADERLTLSLFKAMKIQ